MQMPGLGERELDMTMTGLTVRDELEAATTARFIGIAESGSTEWLELRSQGIGGSEVGIITGVNRWESPFTLWCKKTGRIQVEPLTSEAVEWGNRLEPVILDKFTSEHPELEVLRDVGTWCHAERDWQIANPDAMFRQGGEYGIIEVKTAQYEDDWAEGVPPSYEAQVQWYLQVFGLTRAYVVALFHGNRYREFEVNAAPLAQDVALAAVTEFREYVLTDVQPDFDGAMSTYQTVRALHPEITDDEVELGWLGVGYFGAEAAFKEAEAELNKYKSHILDAMGTAKRGLVEGVWTFSRQARGTGTPYLVLKRQ